MKEQLAQIGNRALNAVAYGAIATGVTMSIIENAKEAAVDSSVDRSMDKFIKEHDDFHKQFPDANTMPVGIVPNNYTEEMLKADPIETFRRGQEMKDLADRENDAVLWYGLSAAGIALKVTRRGHKLRRENKQNETALAAVEQQAANTWNSASAVIGKLRYETAAYREREGVFVNGILAQAGAINVSPDVLQQVINNAGHHAYRVVPPVVWQQYPAEAAPAQAPAPQPQPQQPMAQPAPAPLRRPEVVPQLVAEPEQPPPVTPAVVEPEPTREPVREPEATRIAPEPVVEPVVEQPPVVANQTETETPQPEPPRSELPRPAPVPAAAPQSNASRWLRRSQSNDDAPPPRERRPDRDDEQA